MATNNNIKPTTILHPGATLSAELKARHWTQAELSRRTGKPYQAISEIIRGKKAITAEFAVVLERVLGTSAELWLRMEADYRLHLARGKARKRNG